MGHYADKPRLNARHLVYDIIKLVAATPPGWSRKRMKRFSKHRLYFKVDLFFLEGKFMMEGTIRIGGGDAVDAR